MTGATLTRSSNSRIRPSQSARGSGTPRKVVASRLQLARLSPLARSLRPVRVPGGSSSWSTWPARATARSRRRCDSTRTPTCSR